MLIKTFFILIDNSVVLNIKFGNLHIITKRTCLTIIDILTAMLLQLVGTVLLLIN